MDGLDQNDDEDDDESTEELFSQPSTSKTTSVNKIVRDKSVLEKKEPEFHDVDISTDFGSILDSRNDA